MNNTPMKASIVIPVKNPGPHFVTVIQAVLSQATDFDYEVLVIDSGSTDGTLDYLRQLNTPKLRLHTISPHDYGHGKTRNLGIAMTTGTYAVLITHDALPADTAWLSNMVATAEADPLIAGVFGRHLAYPSADPFTTDELVRHFEGFLAHPVVWLQEPQRYAQDVGYRQFLHFFSDNNALVRRSVWEKHPYPDVNFAEDQLWAKLIIEAGYKKAYTHHGAVYHSHNYKLWERLQRSFDESQAFYTLFGYTLSPNLRTALQSAIGLSLRNFAYARRTGLWRKQPLAVARAPFDNLMKTLGHYLGRKGTSMPEWLRQKLSWDHRLHAGLRTAHTHTPQK